MRKRGVHNLEDIWLSVNECHNIMSCSKKTIYRMIKSNMLQYRYVVGKGRGGKQLQILLSSLLPAAQDKYFNDKAEKKNQDYWDILKKYSGKEREKADFKLRAVREYHYSKQPVDEFLKQFNENYNTNVTRSQLFRWQKKEKEGGFENLIDLRGKHNGQHSTIPEEAWDFFKSLYLNQNQRSVQICYDYTKRHFDNPIPSVHAFRRRLKTIPKNVLIYYREGEKAFNDKCIPDMQRDIESIQSNEIWCSDHHRLDVFTKDTTGKKITRMWLTIFQDVRSSKIVAALCRDAEPNATAVKMCLKEGIKKFGIPQYVYFDNGKDYRSKYFDKDFPLSLVEQLGIKTMYAQPYHGQSKICERTFRTLIERFAKMFPTYTGKDAKNRPEKMRISNEEILKQAPDKDLFINLLYNWIEEFNNTPSKGKGCQGKTPNKVYYENLYNKVVLQDEGVLNILCGTFEERVINKNGINFKNRLYTHSELIKHMGERVIINYSPENMDRLNVFDKDVNAICVAVPKVITPYRATTEEDWKKAGREKKKARKAIAAFKPVREKEEIELIAAYQIEEKQYKDSIAEVAAVTDENVIPKINPVMSSNNQVLTGSDSPKRNMEYTNLFMEKWKNEAMGG